MHTVWKQWKHSVECEGGGMCPSWPVPLACPPQSCLPHAHPPGRCQGPNPRGGLAFAFSIDLEKKTSIVYVIYIY